MVMPCNVTVKSGSRPVGSQESCGSRALAARAVQKQTPLWELVRKYHGLGATPDETAQKAGLRHVFLDIVRTALEFSKVPKSTNVLTPEYFEAYNNLLNPGVSAEFLASDSNLLLTRFQTGVLFGTGMARTGRFMSVSRAYRNYLLTDFESCSQHPVAVPLL